MGIITSTCASLVVNETVKQNHLVVLKEYIINTLATGQKVCIIMGMEPAPMDDEAEPVKIGEPVKWDEAAAAAVQEVKAEESVVSASPKGGVAQHESPKTGGPGGLASRQASYANRPPAQMPASQPPGAPLIAARSAPIDALNPCDTGARTLSPLSAYRRLPHLLSPPLT